MSSDRGWSGLAGPFIVGLRKSRQQGRASYRPPAIEPPHVDCALPCHWPARSELSRVAAEQEHPRLWVAHEYPGRWVWSVTGPDACLLDSGHGETWPAALAVGLAALEVASMAGSRP